MTQQRYARVSASALVLLACAEQLRLLFRLLSRYTNEDHALLWLAASDWWRLQIREPTFYGQPYGVTFESIPVAVLHHVFGMRYGTAFPLALQVMALLAWYLLAFGAWKRGLRVAALLTVAAPVLINTEHWVVVGVIGTSVGRLLASAAAAICLLPRPSRFAVGAAVAMGGLAIAIDSAAALICAPAFVWVFAAWCRRARQLWWPAALGMLLPLTWLALNQWFDRHYPDHSLHPRVIFETNQEVLLTNYYDLDRLFGVHSAELLQSGALLPTLCVVLWVLALAVRGWSALAAVSSYIALLTVIAAMPKSLEMMLSLWFPAGRVTIAAPLGLCFIATVCADALLYRIRSSVAPPALRPMRRAALIAIAGLAVLSSMVRAQSWRARIGAIEHDGLAEQRLPLRRVAEVEKICQTAKRAADAADTQIVIFPFDRAANYGCPALYPGLITAYPSYERRYWVLRHLATRTTDRALIWGLEAKECKRKRFRARLNACTELAHDSGVRIDFAVQPPLDVLFALGFPPRPFGADCTPTDASACSWWASRYSSQ